MNVFPQNIEQLIFSRGRSIGGIIPDVTIAEEHVDELEVTTYPVDRGAPIADHAFKKPAIVRATFGWSDGSTLLNSALSSIAEGGGLFKGIRTTSDIYDALLKMQSSRMLFTLKTGKRRYDNMIIEQIKTTSTSETENALIVDVSFREVQLAAATRVTLTAKSKDKKSTDEIKDGGARQPRPVGGKK